MSGSPAGPGSVAPQDGHVLVRPGGSSAEHQGQRGVASVICALYSLESPASSPQLVLPRHSHSMVAGGLLLMS